MKKILIRSLETSSRLLGRQITKRVDFNRVGTYVHIFGSLFIFAVLLIISNKEEKISRNATRIDSVAKDVTVKWKTLAINDSASKREIDSIHTKVDRHQKVIAANDEKFTELQKELEQLKLNQEKFNRRIDKMTPEELAGYFGTKKMPAK